MNGRLASLLPMVWCGKGILSADSRCCAAWLTIFHPVFRHAVWSGARMEHRLQGRAPLHLTLRAASRRPGSNRR